MDPTSLTACEVREAIVAGSLSAREVVEACLARIEAYDPQVGAFLHTDPEGARAAAEEVDRKAAQGGPLGRLAGVPVAIKDNLCAKGAPTTCASRMLETFRPPYDAHVVERLRAEDAVIVGKTNMDEFAMGSSTETSALRRTRNPWGADHAPGGSSGGSAAAVSAGFVPLALGSDTGGSIRQPASFCGCVGAKPTYGMVSRYGLVAFGSSLDQIGPLARTVRDAALCLEAVAGHDPRDATSAEQPIPELQAELDRSDSGWRVGVPMEYFGEGLDPEVGQAVRGAIQALEDRGAEVREVHLPHLAQAIPVYYIVATAEASSNLARYDGVHYGHRSPHAANVESLMAQTRDQAFGAEVKRRIMLGTYVLSAGYYDAYYLRASRVRTLIAQDFENALQDVDVLAAPTSPTVAFRLGEKMDDPLAMYLSDVYTVSVNLAGIPAVSVPCGEAEGLPVGVQLMGRRFDDARVLAAAQAVEQACGHVNQVAPVG